jgi:hypothetical protein
MTNLLSSTMIVSCDCGVYLTKFTKRKRPNRTTSRFSSKHYSRLFVLVDHYSLRKT